MQRDILPINTLLNIKGDYYQITGEPIGYGGTGVLYPAQKVWIDTTHKIYVYNQIDYCIKECNPAEGYFRDDNLTIVPNPNAPKPGTIEALKLAKTNMLSEAEVSSAIYKKGFRVTPVIVTADHMSVSLDNGLHFQDVSNTVSVLENLSEKGKPLGSYAENRKLPLVQALRITEQLLLALSEVHNSGYLHLDLNPYNIYIKGSLDESGLVSLIDFGCSKKLLHDGLTDNLSVDFFSPGFTAPEIYYLSQGSEKTIRLGKEADLYTVGRILLYMLIPTQDNTNLTNRDVEEIFQFPELYYSPKVMREINCPEHLKDRMSKIIAKAIAPSPSERYHSAEEFRVDLLNIISSLLPHSQLQNVDFDAFIAYEHDVFRNNTIVPVLHKKLEHLHIPAPFTKLLNGRKKLKVFLDRGELSACEDEGIQIKEALANSRYLIVVLTKESHTCQWLENEIQFFLQNHSHGQILTLLTEGSTSSVYPKNLIEYSTPKDDRLPVPGKPFSADIRANTLKEALSLLKKHEYLRLAAPILGTNFDVLYDRHKRYQRKRLYSCICGAVILACAFSAFGHHQYVQIAALKQEAMIQEAKKDTAAALAVYRTGDPQTAKQLLSNTLASEQSLFPEEQLYALNTILGSYDTGSNYFPIYKSNLSLKHICISDDGNLIAGISDQGISVFATNDGESFNFISGKQLNDASALENAYSEIRNICFLSDTKLLVFGERVMCILDCPSCTIQKEIPISENIAYSSALEYTDAPVCSYNAPLLAYAGADNKLYIYHLNSGEEILSKNINAKIRSIQHANNRLLLGTEMGTLLFDLETQKMTGISDNPAVQACFLSSERIASVESAISDTAETSSFGDQELTYDFVIYDISGKKITAGESSQANNQPWALSAVSFSDDTMPKNCLLAYSGNTLVLIDSKKGTPIMQNDFGATICNAAITDKDSILCTLSNGKTMEILIDFSANEEIIVNRFQRLSLDYNTQHAFYSGSDKLILYNDSSVVACKKRPDPEMMKISPSELFSEEMMVSDVCFVESEGLSFRILQLYPASNRNPLIYLTPDPTAFTVYLSGTDQCIYSYKSPDGSPIKEIDIHKTDNQYQISFIDGSEHVTDVLPECDSIPENLPTDYTYIGSKDTSWSEDSANDTGIYGHELSLSFAMPDGTEHPYATVPNGYYDPLSGEVGSISSTGDYYYSHVYSYQELYEKMAIE